MKIDYFTKGKIQQIEHHHKVEPQIKIVNPYLKTETSTIREVGIKWPTYWKTLFYRATLADQNILPLENHKVSCKGATWTQKLKSVAKLFITKAKDWTWISIATKIEPAINILPPLKCCVSILVDLSFYDIYEVREGEKIDAC